MFRKRRVTASQRIVRVPHQEMGFGFRATGADHLITACPYCKGIFQKVLGNEKDRVKDFVEFVDERTEGV